ncbi:hypothetical protein MMMDOFMJ_4503 [Methylobacterium gnaphalii]|nr:hypothetical protein MMMDOFMJ_4503 [Methylobacterium gnaphalii]
MLAAMARAEWSGEATAIDATYVKALRTGQGAKGPAQAIGPSRSGQTTKAVGRSAYSCSAAKANFRVRSIATNRRSLPSWVHPSAMSIWTKPIG